MSLAACKLQLIEAEQGRLHTIPDTSLVPCKCGTVDVCAVMTAWYSEYHFEETNNSFMVSF